MTRPAKKHSLEPAFKSTVTKLSISVPTQLANDVKERVGGRGLSGFVARALSRELEREQLKGYLGELDRRLGPVPESLLEETRRAWRGR